jgi:hypothetical protein
MKFALAFALVGSAAAFAPQASVHTNTALNQHIGAGGMADTRDPDAMEHEDPRKSISAAPSFEEYLKQRAGEGTTAAAAPAAAAPAAAAPAAGGGGGGDILSTLKTLEGAGHVWGADGIAAGKEESDIRKYDSFGKFAAIVEAAGIDLSGKTIFAPTDDALGTYEAMRGEVTADVVKMHIVEGKIASKDIPTTPLNSLNGALTYRYAVRKNFVNDAVIGEGTFGGGPDYPIDIDCGDSIIHTVSHCFAL